MSDLDQSKNPVIVLCGVDGCCPTVTINRDEGMFIITDDYGGKVQLTAEQWEFAKERVKI